MTQARSTLISATDTPYYHGTSRCVRRTFLGGYDNHSQTDYEHRRQWLEDRLINTAKVFSIKLTDGCPKLFYLPPNLTSATSKSNPSNSRIRLSKSN